MNDTARALLARIAKTAVAAVRSMQAPDDLPPKTGPREETPVPETPKTPDRATVLRCIEVLDQLVRDDYVSAEEGALAIRVRLLGEPCPHCTERDARWRSQSPPGNAMLADMKRSWLLGCYLVESPPDYVRLLLKSAKVYATPKCSTCLSPVFVVPAPLLDRATADLR